MSDSVQKMLPKPAEQAESPPVDSPLTENFSRLPEDCMVHILSHTTPGHTVAFSSLSDTCRSAAESNYVWEGLLPSDIRSIISRSEVLSQPDPNLNKKDLFFHLCDTPLLIDRGSKSFSLEKSTGNKCYMIAASALTIGWGDTPRHCSWKNLPEARFSKVAELLDVRLLEIRGSINTGMLSSGKRYAAYLVCKFTNANEIEYTSKEIECTSLDVSVGIAGGGSPTQTVSIGEKWRSRLVTPGVIARSRPRERSGHYLRKRRDGWLEIKLGEYSNNGEADKELEMSLKKKERQPNWKSGLVIQGIEIRPTESNKTKE